MVVIKELDSLLPSDITDLLCGFLSLEDIHLTRKHWGRVYTSTKDAYGLRVPKSPFHYCVWNHRWEDIDMSDGIKLCALSKLTQKLSDFGEDYLGEFTVETLVDHKGDILSSLFIDKFYDPGHPECSRAFTHWLYCNPQEITEEEWTFLSAHWHGIWQPRIVHEMMNLDDYEIRMSGLGTLIAHMFQMALASACVSESCLKTALEYVSGELKKNRQSSFLRNIWILHRSVFCHIHKAMQCARNEDEEFNEFIEHHYELWSKFLYPPFTPSCPRPLNYNHPSPVQEPMHLFIA